MKPGKFIVFEGINGCGKGTQLIRLIDTLFEDRANTFFLTREPNLFDDNGKKARELLNSNGDDPYSENLNAVRHMSMNRATHNEIFRPMLDQGIDVFSDRYYDSTFAFQHAQGISYGEITKMNKSFRVPDLTYIFDLSVEMAIERLSKRDGDSRRKFDSNKEFMEKVRNNYLELPKILPELLNDNSIVIIDGSRIPGRIAKEVREIYYERFAIKD